MKTFSLSLIFLLAITKSHLCFSQDENISGKIIGQDGKPLEGAVVSLLMAHDSSLVKVCISDERGEFGFFITKTEKLIVKVSMLSYKPSKSQVIELAFPTKLLLPDIQLIPESNTELNKVDIVSRIPFVQKQIDKTVITPDALITTGGLSTLEVLEKSPGIRVDGNGTVTLKGKQGVVMYVDDKPVYLQGEELANYLRSLPASGVGKIEILTNPPAKYDAEGNAGVINIRLKKTLAKGFNGSIATSYGQGMYPRSNNSFNFNYRISKINFFTNAGYAINSVYQDLTIKRKYFNDSGYFNSGFTQNTIIHNQARNFNYKAGVDLYASERSTFGGVFTGFTNFNRNTTSNVAQVTDNNQELQTVTLSNKPSKRKLRNNAFNVNYAFKPDSMGKELLINADYSKYRSFIDQSLLSETYLPDQSYAGSSSLISELPASIEIKTAKVDYSHPFYNGLNLEAGAKTSFVRSKNVASFYDEVAGILTVNSDFTNSFNYKEDIQAAYINASKEGVRFSAQAGLRFEHTQITGLQYGNAEKGDSSFNSDYNSLFPTFYFTYKLDTNEHHQFGFSYGRRVERPNYQDMNPFTYPLDRFTLYSGNPFLKPTFSNNFELSYTYNNNITTTFLYSSIDDVITETIEQNTNTFYSRPGNIGEQTSYGISLNGMVPVFKWLALQMYTEAMFNSYKSILYNQVLDNSGWYWYVGPTLQFQINKSWSAECSGSYQTRIVSSQFLLIPVGTVNAGVSKKVMEGKGTLKFNISDAFFTNQPGGEIKNLYNSSAGWKSQLDTRVATMSFSYRFNKGQSLTARNNSAIDAEKARVK